MEKGLKLSRRAFVAGIGVGASASLAACATAPKTKSGFDADILVIGAGLSGLHATKLLEEAGLKVILLEGNDRTGGRLYTLDNLPGTPDAGGVQVGASYTRFNRIADRLNVERYVPEASSRGYLYNIRGTTFQRDDWVGLPVNILATGEKKITPDALFFHYLRKMPALKNVADWMAPEARQMDISLLQFLKMQGASDEAIRLMGINLNGNALAGQSALHMQRSLAIFKAGAKAGPTKFVRGGSQRMTDAMTSDLRSDIVLNAKVSAIRDTGSRVEITLADDRKFTAPQAICTAPFSTVREMQIDAPIPAGLRNVMRQLPYTKASFAFLQARTPFWKEDSLPESVWSDDPLIGRIFALNGTPPILKVWVNGPQADALDKMDERTAAAEMIKRIETIRPSAKGQLSFLHMFSWQKQRFAKGIYHHIGTGQRAMLSAAALHEGSRLHFAGEHLSQTSSGMEGALETAERAVELALK